MARSKEAAVNITRAFKDGVVEKEYVARVQGRLPSPTVDVDKAIALVSPNPPTYGVAIPENGGKVV